MFLLGTADLIMSVLWKTELKVDKSVITLDYSECSSQFKADSSWCKIVYIPRPMTWSEPVLLPDNAITYRPSFQIASYYYWLIYPSKQIWRNLWTEIRASIYGIGFPWSSKLATCWYALYHIKS